jgi:hypothetical protein
MLQDIFSANGPDRNMRYLRATLSWTAEAAVPTLFRSRNRIATSRAGFSSERRSAEAPESCDCARSEDQAQCPLPPRATVHLRQVPMGEWPHDEAIYTSQNEHGHEHQEDRDCAGRNTLENQHAPVLFIAGWTIPRWPGWRHSFPQHQAIRFPATPPSYDGNSASVAPASRRLSRGHPALADGHRTRLRKINQ